MSAVHRQSNPVRVRHRSLALTVKRMFHSTGASFYPMGKTYAPGFGNRGEGHPNTQQCGVYLVTLQLVIKLLVGI